MKRDFFLDSTLLLIPMFPVLDPMDKVIIIQVCACALDLIKIPCHSESDEKHARRAREERMDRSIGPGEQNKISRLPPDRLSHRTAAQSDSDRRACFDCLSFSLYTFFSSRLIAAAAVEEKRAGQTTLSAEPDNLRITFFYQRENVRT